MGDTYGTTTHKLLLDPTVNHAEKLVLSDRTVDDYQVRKKNDMRINILFLILNIYQVYRPPQRDIDIVNARTIQGDPVYKHPTIPGYEGTINKFMLTAFLYLNNHLFKRICAKRTWPFRSKIHSSSH